MLRVALADLGKGLACALQISLGEVHLTQPVLGVAGVLTVGIAVEKSGERLRRLVEILGLDQVEGSVVIEFFLGRITRLGACLLLSGRGVGVPLALIAPLAEFAEAPAPAAPEEIR